MLMLTHAMWNAEMVGVIEAMTEIVCGSR